MMTRVKTQSELKAMRAGGRILARTLETLQSQITDRTKASDIDKLAAGELKRRGGKPAFLGFQGFPANVCVSLNDEIVHGLPKRDKVIAEGDVVTLDLGVNYGDMIVDGAITFLAGRRHSSENTKLVETTKESLNEGLLAIRSGCRVGDISSRIQAILEKNQLGIVRELVGHGVGHGLHEEPNIPNFGSKGTGPQLVAGMTFAIEPMATLGKGDIYVAEDGWTVKTKDGSAAAQFEHTILITDNGHEILTTQ